MDTIFSHLVCAHAQLPSPLDGFRLRIPRSSHTPPSLGNSTLTAFTLRAAAAASTTSPQLPNVSDLSPSQNTTGLPTPAVTSSDPLFKVDLEQGPTRYAAYAMRLKTVIVSSSRYIAYSSDIGEAFRPLTRPEVVRAAYGISWLYLLCDVGWAGYKTAKGYEAKREGEGVVERAEEKAKKAAESLGIDEKTLEKLGQAHSEELRRRGQQQQQPASVDAATSSSTTVGEGTSVALVMARRAVFQSLASMALPALTIHSIVRYSAPIFARSSRPRIRAAGPTVAGLAFVPALPFVFDHPVEHVVDLAFDWMQEAVWGSGTTRKKVEEVEEEVKRKIE